jgi:D-amino-acid dehydrogenase
MAGADVAIVGGGAIGVCVAAELARSGASVVLLERGAHPGAGCSAGNAGIVGASHVLPLASPQALAEGLRWMGRSDSPFSLSARPALAPWLARFVAAARPDRVRQATCVLRELALSSAAMHAQLHGRGLSTGYRREGLLNVYADPGALSDAGGQAQADARDGLPSEVLDAAALRDAHPYLAAGAAGAVWYPDEAHCDPLAFVRAVEHEAVSAVAQVCPNVEVLSMRRRGTRISGLWTTAGEITASQVVLAAGAWTPPLVRALGYRLPVEGGKGYHVDVPAAPGDATAPVWLHDSRTVVTPLAGRTRIAGTLQLVGRDERVDTGRVDAIMRQTLGALPGLVGRPAREVWRGLRPCTPDGLPVIGRPAGLDNLVLATGHGMWGLQLAPVTGQLVAALVGGGAPSHDLRPLSPDRFRTLPRSRTTAVHAAG